MLKEPAAWLYHSATHVTFVLANDVVPVEIALRRIGPEGQAHSLLF